MSVLSASLNAYMSTEKVEWFDDTFNYLAIGNSITKHGTGDSWWNEVGMAATDEEHDYYHLVLKGLESQGKNVTSYVQNFATWEAQSKDRDETFMLIDSYLDDEIDLVTIQLGENASDLTTFKEDYISLINYIKQKAPKAQLIIVGDFWENGNRDSMKEAVASECEVTYVSLAKIKNNTDYQCGVGAIVYDAQGNEHTVEHEGVAAHPNNRAMEYIANTILNNVHGSR
ncbi:MAG: SGNH/GDSL hydrolase family protein [Lachnospiraceae bacterium]|nr:SGNH/GDSL hydrolase family protein [Lachnospiraceae bacterium]